jgi:AmiR/NasT family two-component response regulator
MGNGSGFAHGVKVTQASGMVSVQAACSVDEALALMRDRATVQRQTMDQIAEAVLDRRIRFGAEP